jgi:hypothetical protein
MEVETTTHPRTRRVREWAWASAVSASPPAVMVALGVEIGSEKTPKAMSASKKVEATRSTISMMA